MSYALVLLSGCCVAIAWVTLGGSGVAQGEGHKAASDILAWIGTGALLAAWITAFFAGKSDQ